MRLVIHFALFISLPSILSAEVILRDWTNIDGKTISAELVGVEGGKATLKMSNGRQYEISLATLSEPDRTFAAAWQSQQQAGDKADRMGLKLGVPTDVIVESPFNEDSPRTRKGVIAGWDAGIGEWRIEDGVLIGDEVAEDNHPSSLTRRVETENLIITAQIQLGTAEQIAFACRDTVPPNLHLARLYVTQDKVWIQHMGGIAKSTKAEKLVTKEVKLNPDEWYNVTIEIIGDHYRATVGDVEIEATHSRFADAKGIVALVNKGQGAKYRNVSLWQAKAAK